MWSAHWESAEMADQPTVAADRVLPLPIAEALRDRDCADALAIGVSNLPPGTVLSAGTDNGDGSWTLATADLDGLTIAPPADRFGNITLTVSAVAHDAIVGLVKFLAIGGIKLGNRPKSNNSDKNRQNHERLLHRLPPIVS